MAADRGVRIYVVGLWALLATVAAIVMVAGAGLSVVWFGRVA
jgi:hypothetical protein